MSTVTIDLLDGVTSFVPGAPIDGVVTWNLDSAAPSIEVRLLWYTDGKGDRDVALVDTVRYDAPPAADAQAFSFVAPVGPFSFAGQITSLSWAVEAHVEKQKKLIATMPIVIAPHAREVTLHGGGDDPSDGQVTVSGS